MNQAARRLSLDMPLKSAPSATYSQSLNSSILKPYARQTTISNGGNVVLNICSFKPLKLLQFSILLHMFQYIILS